MGWPVEVAKRLDDLYGPALDLYRGRLPRGPLCILMAYESGGDRFAVSADWYLVEVGLSQEPLARAAAADVDPFSPTAAMWLRAKGSLADLAALEHRCGTPIHDPANAAYAALLAFAVGPGAAAFIVQHGLVRGGAEPGKLAGACIRFADTFDLSCEAAVAKWGRQQPAVIAKRIRLAAHRLAQGMGMPGTDPGPPPQLPTGLPGLPVVLEEPGRTARNPTATRETRKAMWRVVRRYAIAARRVERGERSPLLARILGLPRLRGHGGLPEDGNDAR